MRTLTVTPKKDEGVYLSLDGHGTEDMFGGSFMYLSGFVEFWCPGLGMGLG